MGKYEIRKMSLAARRALTPGQCAEYSRRIHMQLKKFPAFKTTPCVLTYINSKDNEVETIPLVEELLAHGQCVLAPRCAKAGTMEWCKISSLDDLEKTSFGIFEPKAIINAVIPPANSICLVPGIVFRSDGHRIGYGGGYFDKFLKNYTDISVGLAYQFQVKNQWIPDLHDIPVKYVYTENGPQ